jgi:hypothetical protein
MNNILIVSKAIEAVLASINIKYSIKVAKSGSIYIKLKKINELIRISDHRKFNKVFLKYNVRSDIKKESIVRVGGKEKYIYPMEKALDLCCTKIYFDYYKRGYCEKRKKSTLYRNWNKAVEMYTMRETSDTSMANML